MQAYRHSEAGTPRVGPRDRGAGDPRVFHLAFRGAALARIELHTAHEGPLFPGCTFSVTVDFRAPDGAAKKRAACHQVRPRHPVSRTAALPAPQYTRITCVGGDCMSGMLS